MRRMASCKPAIAVYNPHRQRSPVEVISGMEPGWYLDMSKVQDKLDTGALALANRIEREWPARYARLELANGFFAMTVRLARITFRTVAYVCADQRLQEPEWKWYYTLALPPLYRTILDAIFNVVYAGGSGGAIRLVSEVWMERSAARFGKIQADL